MNTSHKHKSHYTVLICLNVYLAHWMWASWCQKGVSYSFLYHGCLEFYLYSLCQNSLSREIMSIHVSSGLVIQHLQISGYPRGFSESFKTNNLPFKTKQTKSPIFCFVLFLRKANPCLFFINLWSWNQAILQIKVEKIIHRKTLFILTFHSAFITYLQLRNSIES